MALDSIRLLTNVASVNLFDIVKSRYLYQGCSSTPFYIQLWQSDVNERYIPTGAVSVIVEFLRIDSTAQTPVSQTVIKTLTQPYSTIDPSIWYVELIADDVSKITSGGIRITVTEGANIYKIYSKMCIRKIASSDYQFSEEPINPLIPTSPIDSLWKRVGDILYPVISGDDVNAEIIGVRGTYVNIPGTPCDLETAMSAIDVALASGGLWDLVGNSITPDVAGRDLDMGSGDILLTGAVDGRDISADGLILDSHVANTSIHHTNAQILSLIGGLLVDKGDLLTVDALGALSRFPVGADGYGLVADASQPFGLRWGLAAQYWTRVGTVLSPTTAGDDVDLGTGDIKAERMQSKYEPFYNAKHWGAVGDGVTDDTAAVQSLVASIVASNGGGMIYFPRGTYKINTALNFSAKNNITIFGDGEQVSILDFSGEAAGNAIFNIGNRFTLERLSILGVNVIGGKLISNSASRSNVVLRRLRLENCYIGISGSFTYSNFSHILVNNFNNIGMEITGVWTGNTYLSHCFCYSTAVGATIGFKISNSWITAIGCNGTADSAWYFDNSFFNLIDCSAIGATWDIAMPLLNCNGAINGGYTGSVTDLSKIQGVDRINRLTLQEDNIRTNIRNIEALTFRGTATDDGTLYFWDTSKYIRSGTAPDTALYLSGFGQFDLGGATLIGGASPFNIKSKEADGASAIAFNFDTNNALSTAGAKLWSLKNNAAEKVYIDKDGREFFEGSYTRTVPVYNVKAHGLIGDGVTDDAPALQTLITTVGNAGGGVVYFPKSIYLLNSTINFANKPNISVIGDGLYISELKFTNNVSGIALSNIARRSYFRDINISDIRLQAGVGGLSFGAPCYNITFERITFSSYYSTNSAPIVYLSATGASNISFRDCIFTCPSNLGNGISLYNAANIVIDNCWFLRGAEAVYVRNSDTIRINNCLMNYAPQKGIYMDGVYNSVISACNITGASTYGIHLTGTTVFCWTITIEDCDFNQTVDIKADAGVVGCTLKGYLSWVYTDYTGIDGLAAFDTILGSTDPYGDYFPGILKNIESITLKGNTHGGRLYFAGGTSDYIESNLAGTELDIVGFDSVDLNGATLIGGASPFNIKSKETDGASAIAFNFSTLNELTTEGAKFISLSNDVKSIFEIKRGTTLDTYYSDANLYDFYDQYGNLVSQKASVYDSGNGYTSASELIGYPLGEYGEYYLQITNDFAGGADRRDILFYLASGDNGTDPLRSLLEISDVSRYASFESEIPPTGDTSGNTSIGFAAFDSNVGRAGATGIVAPSTISPIYTEAALFASPFADHDVNMRLSIYGGAVNNAFSQTNIRLLAIADNTNVLGLTTDGKFITEPGIYLSNKASGIALTLGSINALSAPGDKLLSVQNATVEKLSIDKDGYYGYDLIPAVSESLLLGSSALSKRWHELTLGGHQDTDHAGRINFYSSKFNNTISIYYGAVNGLLEVPPLRTFGSGFYVNNIWNAGGIYGEINAYARLGLFGQHDGGKITWDNNVNKKIWAEKSAHMGNGLYFLGFNDGYKFLNPNVLGSEVLTTLSAPPWTVGGDAIFDAGYAKYTHNTGVGNWTLPSAQFLTVVKPNTWYLFTYTVQTSGSTVLPSIDSSFAVGGKIFSFDTYGAQTVFFKTTENPGDFIINATSTSGTIWFQPLSLKEVQDGDVYVGKDLDVTGNMVSHGGRKVKRIAIAADYDVLIDDYLIGITNTAAPRNIRLMSATLANGKTYKFKDESGGAAANIITISTEGAETIDGQPTYVINVNYGSVEIYSDGNNWFAL